MTGWVEVASERRGVLVEMFAAWPGLHGCIAAVLEGGMGRAFAYWIPPPRSILIDIAATGWRACSQYPRGRSSSYSTTLITAAQ